ncbi:MAG TPA: cytochrome c [Abditibacteriaceae bacterium]|jgi:hypothetical protein
MKKLFLVLSGAAVLLPLAGCDRNMKFSPVDMWNRSRYKPLEPSPFFSNGSSTQPPVPGTVARGQLRTDELLYQGRVRGSGVSPLTTQGDGNNLAMRGSTGGSNASVGTVRGINNRGQGGRNTSSADLPVGDNGLGTDVTLATQYPFPITMTVLKRGEERYNTFCSPCHARVGDGNGMIVERGFPKPPSFHIDRLRKAPVGHYFDVITHGYGAMYPYGSRVETRDRWAIIAYIRLLQSRSAKYGIDGPQTDVEPGKPLFKGGRPSDLKTNRGNEKNSEFNPNAGMQVPNLIDDPNAKSSVGQQGLTGATKSGTATEHETGGQPHGGAH